MRQRTLPINMQKLPVSNDSNLIMRVGMAVNDIASGDFFLKKARELDAKKQPELRQGLEMYAIRLQISHFREALFLVEEIKAAEKSNDSRLVWCIGIIPNKFRQQYNLLLQCLPGETDWDRFNRTAIGIRNGVTFHYDKSAKRLTHQTMKQMSQQMRHPIQNIVEGENLPTSRIAPADAVVDRAVCNILLEIDPASCDNMREKLDEEIMWCHERAIAFHNFGFSLCIAYLQHYGAG